MQQNRSNVTIESICRQLLQLLQCKLVKCSSDCRHHPEYHLPMIFQSITGFLDISFKRDCFTTFFWQIVAAQAASKYFTLRCKILNAKSSPVYQPSKKFVEKISLECLSMIKVNQFLRSISQTFRLKSRLDNLENCFESLKFSIVPHAFFLLLSALNILSF